MLSASTLVILRIEPHIQHINITRTSLHAAEEIPKYHQLMEEQMVVGEQAKDEIEVSVDQQQTTPPIVFEPNLDSHQVVCGLENE